MSDEVFFAVDGLNRSNPPTVPYLEIIYGPMGSRKTSSAIMEASSWANDPCFKEVIYINNIIDKDRETTGGEKGKFSSHNDSNVKLSDKVKTQYVSVLSQVDFERYDVFIVDEGQFYTDLVSEVKKFLSRGKRVYVYGLIGDARGERFGNMLDLFPMADKITQLFAVCNRCLDLSASRDEYKQAAFTARYSTEQSQVVIGGMNLYYACCRKHHPILSMHC